MIAKDDIVIRKAILHILDTVHGDCILSNTLLIRVPICMNLSEITFIKLSSAMIPKTANSIQRHPRLLCSGRLG